MEAVECGPVSLSIILAYYGKYVPLERLRLDCGVSRHGSSCIHLIKAASMHGLEAEGYSMEIPALQRLQAPCILFWKFQHFIVLEGFSKKFVFINDPQTGPRRISYQELNEGFTGITLTFKPTKAFKKEGSPSNLLKDIYARLKNESRTVLFFFLASVCLIIPGLALPAFTRVFFDAVLGRETLSFCGVFFIGLGMTAMAAAFLTWLQQYLLLRLNTKLATRFSSDFLWHVLRLPLNFYTQRYAGEIGYRMGSNIELSQILTGTLATASIDLFLILFYAAMMFLYDPLIATIGCLAAILALTLLALGSRSRHDICTRLRQGMAQSIGISIEALNHIETIKAAGLESRFFTRWAGLHAKNINAQQELGKKDAWISSIPLLLQSIAIAVLLTFGSWRVLHGSLTIGMLMALQILMLSFLVPVHRFINFTQTIQMLKIHLGRLNDVLRNPMDVTYQKRAAYRIEKNAQNPKLSGHLEFRNVTFGYNRFEPPLIENLSFVLKPGQRTAFVGPTASGKTTLAKLATHLLQPWSGEILYDGKLFFEIAPEVLHRSLAHVDQEIFLFQGTIRDNLTLWNPDHRDDDLLQSIKDVCFDPEVFVSSQGLEFMLAEEGRNLSSGERQKLEIARALSIQPTLLVLDEATSGLDSESEKQISDHILRRGCTCLMIAHRLSSIKDCDEIIVLEKGRAVQRGRHQELYSVPGVYRNLVQYG
jgi:ATP-binding cassette subfamily C protein